MHEIDDPGGIRSLLNTMTGRIYPGTRLNRRNRTRKYLECFSLYAGQGLALGDEFSERCLMSTVEVFIKPSYLAIFHLPY